MILVFLNKIFPLNFLRRIFVFLLYFPQISLNYSILGNGEIEFNEFTDMIRKTKSISDPEEDLKKAFKVFDLDGDGVITVC